MARPIFQRIGDRLLWWACAAAFRIYMATPHRFGASKFAFAILPWAGLYAHSSDYADYLTARDWHRAGRPRPVPSPESP